jgi:hypothetical protein
LTFQGSSASNSSSDWERRSTQSSIHFYIDWAKERLDEMEAALTSLESKVGGVQADARDTANKILADLRKNRDGFRDAVKKQSRPPLS